MSLSRVPRQQKFALVHEHAGVGVYQPQSRKGLKFEPYGAIGRTVDLDFAGIAGDDERFAGQNLYQEHDGERILQGSWIPEQDVRFAEPDATSRPEDRRTSRSGDRRTSRPGGSAGHTTASV